LTNHISVWYYDSIMKTKIKYNKKIEFFVNEEMYKVLKKISNKTKRTISEIIREAILDIVKKYEGR